VTRALVIGSGPNGLSAAIALLQDGVEVEVREAAGHLGGGLHTEELTLPGFLHDICATVQPLAAGSPFFRSLDLGVEWVHPAAPAAHPLDDGTAVVLERGIDETADGLGRDGAAYRRLVEPLVEAWDELAPVLLGPLPPPPRRTLRAARAAGLGPLAAGARAALGDARSVAESLFQTERARAWFAGHCAHSMLPLERRPSAGFGLALAVLAHAVGWPFARGGSSRLADALSARVRELGGTMATDSLVDELPQDRLVLADVVPRELVRLARGRLPERYERRLRRFRHGPGAFKVDWALDGPIPWSAPECCRAGTVHLGGTFDEIAQSEWAAWSGRPATRPFVLLVQQTVFDDTRAPAGKHSVWAYCHVPNGSTFDMTERIEAQVERFAPGFHDLVLARHTIAPAEFEARNRNLVGGDLNGGAMDLGQLVFRPAGRLAPYRTPLEGVYLCSSSTPPGGGVHGMCGYWAAQAALRGAASVSRRPRSPSP
jgi:phytoene dehydrogenase-like protein